ncbi:MAG: transposase [Paludibacter sp.]
MQQKGIREDRKKVDEAVLNKSVNLAVGINFPALPRYLTYLELSNVKESLAEIEVHKERKCWGHMEVFPLIYLCKFMVGISSTRGSKELLANKALLSLLGFTDKEIDKGLTERGKANQYGNGYERKSEIVAEPTVVDNISAFDHKDVILCFNTYIKWLKNNGLIDLGDIYILDSTLIETSADYPGAGKTKREEEKDDGSIVEKTIYGFKVFVLMDAKTKIPVSFDITSAEKADCTYLQSMVEKGIENLGKGQIKLLVADRGFIDGTQMWQIKNKLGIDFIIPAKKNMDIWQDVVCLRKEYEDRVVKWKYGKKGNAGGYLVQGALSYAQYAEVAAGNKKYKNGDPLNAVVVTIWGDHPIEAGKEKVLLTTLNTNDAVEVMKSYRMRTFIENCGFRELKQAADLGRLPQRTGEQAERSAYMHMTLCVFSMATFIGFLSWDYERVLNAKDSHSPNSRNLRDYRVESKQNNGYIIVFIEEAYAVYETEELLRMMGMNFSRIKK